MQIRVWVGLSLDGFIAMPDDTPAWEVLGDLFSPQDYGYDELLKEISAVVMGRTTYDGCINAFRDEWPWPDKEVYVLTTRPLAEDAPEGVRAWREGPAALVEHLRGADFEGDVKLMGGAKTVQALREAGGIDRFELFVMPVLLGAGVTMFPTEASRLGLQLESAEALAHGVVKLVYLSLPA